MTVPLDKSNVLNGAQKQAETPPEPLPPKKNHRHRTFFLLTLGLIVIGIIWLLLWLFHFQYYEYTDDAYANGDMIPLNSAISGSVTAFYADNTDLVVEGQLLVQLDCTPYQVAYDRELANLANVVLQVRQLYDNVVVNRANLETRKIALSKAQYDYDNRAKLVESEAISEEEFIHSQDDLKTAKAGLEQAEYQLKMAEAAAGNTDLEKHPALVQQINAVRSAYYNIKHCAIYAPATGYVAQRMVEVGQWVTQASNLLAIIPVESVWVDANYKETQLTYMRVGQPATVEFDIYGSKVVYEGKVVGIASGTGSVFSIIPPQNATGNWIKIVQRLPVRIVLDPEMIKKYPLRLGLSAEVHVDISDQNLPMLVPSPAKRTVGKTEVFDLNFAELDQIIKETIQKNLRHE